MKLNSMLLTLTTVAAAALSGCGAPQTAAFLPVAQRVQAAAVSTHRAAAGQLTYAREMRGFSFAQNPMRMMMLEFTTVEGVKKNMHAERFLNNPEFTLAVRNDNAVDPNQGTEYFSSKDKAKVQALVDTLQNLDTQAVQAIDKEALARILDHLKSAL